MTEKHRVGLVTVMALGLVVVVAYWPAVCGGFLNWDDDRYFTNNPLWRGPVIDYALAAFSRVQFQAYHPLHLLSYLPDRLLWPQHPAGFHVLNLILWVLAWWWLASLLRRHVSWAAALLAAALLAVHPLYAEPVAWITGRKEILAVLAVVAVLWFEDRASANSRFSLIVLILSIVAVLTKSATMVVPILIFGWQRWVLGRTMRHAFARALPSSILAVMVATGVTAIWTSNQMVSTTRPLPLWWDVSGTLSVYVARLFWPVNLSPSYPPTGEHQLWGAVTLWFTLALVVLAWRRLPAPARFAIVVFLGSLLPVSNVVSLYCRLRVEFAQPDEVVSRPGTH